MHVEQLYTGCLAEAAYYIESAGEVAIIDPLRETEQYLEMAKKNEAKIKYVFETHFHADFVSGHVDLALKSGAPIIFGPGAHPNFDAHIASDGEEFKLGEVTLRVLHTPGHTPESSTYLLLDEKGKEHAIFTGDTLFIGDVGRPDLAISSDITEEDLAGMMFDSLRSKIMPLPDHVMVYPAHGAGSACGKNLSEETFSTLGEQKRMNYALQDLSREDFIKELTTDVLPAPQYFAKNAAKNKEGYDPFDTIMERSLVHLEVSEVEAEMDKGALVLDTRDQEDFKRGHIPGAINLGLDGSFATWLGNIVSDLNQTIIVVADLGAEEESIMRMARTGYEGAIGYLSMEDWVAADKKTDSIEIISPSLTDGLENVLDVRTPSEFDLDHVEGATSFPLDFILNQMNKLNKERTYYLYCETGYRSICAVSMLRKEGFAKVINIQGGYEAITKLQTAT